jgi:uncharacterized membrane protein YesL
MNLLGMYATLKTLKYMIKADLKQYYQNMFGHRQNDNVISIHNTSHKVHKQNFTHVNLSAWVLILVFLQLCIRFRNTKHVL